MEENIREKISKIFVYLAKLSSFFGILENAVPFATGSCRKFKADVLIEWKEPKIQDWQISFQNCVYHLNCTRQFHLTKMAVKALKLLSKLALKKCNTNFRIIP